jgi:hypothetical protein
LCHQVVWSPHFVILFFRGTCFAVLPASLRRVQQLCACRTKFSFACLL